MLKIYNAVNIQCFISNIFVFFGRKSQIKIYKYRINHKLQSQNQKTGISFGI